jgi:hypothetical protein
MALPEGSVSRRHYLTLSSNPTPTCRRLQRPGGSAISPAAAGTPISSRNHHTDNSLPRPAEHAQASPAMRVTAKWIGSSRLDPFRFGLRPVL